MHSAWVNRGVHGPPLDPPLCAKHFLLRCTCQCKGGCSCTPLTPTVSATDIGSSIVFHAITLEHSRFRKIHTIFLMMVCHQVCTLFYSTITHSRSEMLSNRHTDTHTYTDDYSNPRACTPRVGLIIVNSLRPQVAWMQASGP